MHNTEIVVVMGINIENGGEDTMYKEVGAKAPSQFRLHTYTHIFMSLGPPNPHYQQPLPLFCFFWNTLMCQSSSLFLPFNWKHHF